VTRGRPAINLTGAQYGDLTVLRRYGSKNEGATWACVCRVGHECVRDAHTLKRSSPRCMECMGKRARQFKMPGTIMFEGRAYTAAQLGEILGVSSRTVRKRRALGQPLRLPRRLPAQKTRACASCGAQYERAGYTGRFCEKHRRPPISARERRRRATRELIQEAVPSSRSPDRDQPAARRSYLDEEYMMAGVSVSLRELSDILDSDPATLQGRIRKLGIDAGVVKAEYRRAAPQARRSRLAAESEETRAKEKPR
jgi:hypothetical protein